LTFAAAVLGSGKVEFIAEYVEEGPLGIALDAMPGPVDDQFHASIVDPSLAVGLSARPFASFCAATVRESVR
jgi:hypothetical protein